MISCPFEAVRERLHGKRVALVGSGPGALQNAPRFVDGHDVVIRVNNYKLTRETGVRTDVFYSFFGASIRKEAFYLQRDGVELCICKCPNAKFIESPWHTRHRKEAGVDFRSIYARRDGWWFCETYVPSVAEFLEKFHLLGGHVPTTGFAAILDVLRCQPAELYLTGFDFFASGVHNLNEPWTQRNRLDPIGHVPNAERRWLARNWTSLPITVDAQLGAQLKRNS